MNMLLYILCQLYLTLWNFGGKSECTPCLSFLNYSSLQKDKYIYTFILFSINNNVAPFTSKSKEQEEVYIIYKTGEENNIFKC